MTKFMLLYTLYNAMKELHFISDVMLKKNYLEKYDNFKVFVDFSKFIKSLR